MLATWTPSESLESFLQDFKPGAQDASGAQKNLGINATPTQASGVAPEQPLTASTAGPSTGHGRLEPSRPSPEAHQ